MSLINILLALTLIFTSSFSLNVNAQEVDTLKVDELSQPIPGKYIVEFNDSDESVSEKADKLAEKYGVQNVHIYGHSFKGANVFVPLGKEKDIKNDPDVKNLVQDFTIYASDKPSDLSKPVMADGGGSVLPQVIPTGINWIDAELNTSNEGSGVTVAVLDTGISFSHPDLMVNIPLSRDFSGDGTGGDDNNTTKSVKGHGTHVAGVIAALDNTRGVLGTGSQIDLVSVKVLNRTGSGSFGGIISGLDYVTANSGVIGVANLSLGATGGTNPSQGFLDVSALLQQAVQRAVNAGVVVVVAAGNSALDVTANNAVPAMYPEVISVSALDDRDGVQGNDKWASFSNFGTEVDIICPGVYILSTAIGGGTSTLSGTSFSSPHVAGTVGLYIARNGRPANGDARLLSSLLNAISQPRAPLTGEPTDGFTEPSCYANGPALQ